MTENESNSDKEVNIIGILQKLVFEKHIGLLEGEDPDASIRRSTSLTYWLALTQLIIADISIFFALISIFVGGIQAVLDIFLFLIGFNVFIVLLIYGFKRRYGRGSARDSSTSWYEFMARKCITCGIDSFYSLEESKVLFHKIENPEHQIDFLKVRVKIFKLERHTYLIGFYDVLIAILFFILLVLYFDEYYPQLILLAYASFASLSIVWLIRSAPKKFHKSNTQLIWIFEDRSTLEFNSTIYFNLHPYFVSKRYLRGENITIHSFPILVDGEKETVLVSNIDCKFGKVFVKPYTKIKPAIYGIFHDNMD